MKLYTAYTDGDADLVEINPLAVIREHGAQGAPVERLVCLDAKITLDDSAIPRHPELEALRDLDEEDPAEDRYLDEESDAERADPYRDPFDGPAGQLTAEDETLLGIDPYED